MANTRSVTVTYDGTQFGSSETGQVLVITRDMLPDEMFDPSGANAARSDGGDLRAFVSSTGIPLEVAAFAHDSATGAGDGTAVIWTRVDTTAATALDVEFQWGDAALTQPAATDPLGSRAVWSDLGAVYNLTDGGLSDSAGNSGAMSWTGTGGSRAGVIAGTTAPATDGASAMSAMYDADVAGLNPYVIRGWVYIVNDAQGYYFGGLNGEEGSAGNAVQIDAAGSESGNPRYLVYTLGEAGIIVNPSSALADQWVYIVLAFSATEAAIYENGVSIYSAARSSAYPSNTERGLVLFRRAPTSTTEQAAAGAAAQFVQIGGPMPSAGRIATEYNNQNPATAATYVTVGTPTSLGGASGITGTLAVTEADDTVAASATLALAGSASITEAGDTVSASATLALAGTVNVTEADDTLTATGTLAIAGASAVTEAGDTVAASGVLPIVGTVSLTEADDTVAGTGVGTLAPNTGTSGIVEADDTVSAAGALAIAGAASIAEAGDTLSAAATLSLSGAAAVTEGDDTVSATGTLAIAAVATITEAGDTVAGTGRLRIVGGLDVTEADDTLSAHGQETPDRALPVNRGLVADMDRSLRASIRGLTATGSRGLRAA